jgi:hypothetical protein
VPPTLYPEINYLLCTLLTEAKAILADQYLGLYLYGSLSSGDFNEESSDIDFVFVTRGELASQTVSQLEALHQRLWVSELKWAAKLEGTYIPQDALRCYQPNGPLCPCVNEGQFYLAQHESDWVIQRYILREKGVAVDGPPIKDMIDPVSPADLRQGVSGILEAWWRPNLADPARFATSAYQSHAVLTMCRALYTLDQGDITSKPVSAYWAKTALDPKWAPLIDWALAWTHATLADHLAPSLDFIRFTLDQLPH